MNYAGVVGPHEVIGAGVPSTFGGLKYCNNLCAGESADILECHGSFWRHSYVLPVTLTSFEDGASKTLIIGEIVPEYDPFRVWALSNGSIAFTSIPINYVDPDPDDSWLILDNMGFHSRHAGGAHFAWADGHVSFLDEMIDQDVYRALSTRFGGETASPP